MSEKNLKKKDIVLIIKEKTIAFFELFQNWITNLKSIHLNNEQLKGIISPEEKEKLSSQTSILWDQQKALIEALYEKIFDFRLIFGVSSANISRHIKNYTITPNGFKLEEVLKIHPEYLQLLKKYNQIQYFNPYEILISLYNVYEKIKTIISSQFKKINPKISVLVYADPKNTFTDICKEIEISSKEASKTKTISYIFAHWSGGLITNFQTTIRHINWIKNLDNQSAIFIKNKNLKKNFFEEKSPDENESLEISEEKKYESLIKQISISSWRRSYKEDAQQVFQRSQNKLQNIQEQERKNQIKKIYERLFKKFSGIKNIEDQPLFIFLFSGMNNLSICKEVQKNQKRSSIYSVGLCDMDINPKEIDLPILGNDDHEKSQYFSWFFFSFALENLIAERKAYMPQINFSDEKK